jgi:hypothetical protein
MVVVAVQGFGGVGRRRPDRAVGDVVGFEGQTGAERWQLKADCRLRIAELSSESNLGLVCAL